MPCRASLSAAFAEAKAVGQSDGNLMTGSNLTRLSATPEN
jgi:hypothetical protein